MIKKTKDQKSYDTRESKDKEHYAIICATADSYIRRETDRTFRHFQKSIDKQFARLLGDAK
jgi:hypothetical protein